MTFEYKLPASEAIVKRTFAADVLELDRFDVIVAGETIATVSYETARKFWLGRIDLATLINDNGTR